MITIADHTLSRLVAQTKPHMADSNDVESLQCLAFDHDGTYLYAMATNRFTMGVARTQLLKSEDEPWTAVVHRMQVPEVAAAIRLLDAKPVTLERTDTHLVLSGESGTRIAIETVQHKQGPLNWRKYLLPLLDEAAANSQMAMTPKFFGAWKGLPAPVQMWSVGEHRPTVILAADFIGMQMPVRTSEAQELTTRRELDAWKAAKPEEPVEQPAAA
ncbi:hypothetical protein ACFYVK_35055 [Streptomyces chartreusis]|uniref:hypothetical protein n=1 Tax=Streptomyces chartreusis TaxID=1969 RepID=UPI00368BBEF4